ncbi:hypothetical protein MPNTM1_00423 [Mycolicibacterium parafortuitum]|uniref:DUF5994 family protein n=1 Tax=Mycolicibacterium parafortuitum TaxID=39692 RepID=UPI0032C41A15
MNGVAGSRRASRPIRLTLSETLGGVIDGAWWPHSGSIAAELPDLVGALHKPLGEIVDIRLNWTATDGHFDLQWIATGSKLPDAAHRRPRLMVIAGRDACVRLLVIPSLTSQALGSIVVRAAAGLPTFSGQGDDRLFETARVVMDVARAESTQWCPLEAVKA